MAPFAGLVRDTRGNFYGTTYYGGGYVCEFAGCGTVFEITREGEEKVLYSFQGADGSHPAASLVLGTQGNLFGTTEYGGAFGYGTVFELSPFGVETVLHHFTGGADGGFPQASLVRDRQGNLYGTTYLGGSTTGVCVSVGCGVVFKITPSGEEDVLYNFAGYPNDGSNPVAGLVLDALGNLYGTTVTGGESASGVVFKITP
jgi:uncharacterized repeat protein (TIGR03803 family)